MEIEPSALQSDVEVFGEMLRTCQNAEEQRAIERLLKLREMELVRVKGLGRDTKLCGVAASEISGAAERA